MAISRKNYCTPAPVFALTYQYNNPFFYAISFPYEYLIALSEASILLAKRHNTISGELCAFAFYNHSVTLAKLFLSYLSVLYL